MYRDIAGWLGVSLILGMYGLLVYAILFHSVFGIFGKVVAVWFFTTIILILFFDVIGHCEGK
mgnify:CR=1 FL=1